MLILNISSGKSNSQWKMVVFFKNKNLQLQEIESKRKTTCSISSDTIWEKQ
jgi:hypothetical protein